MFPDTDPEGCPIPAGLRAWLSNNHIEDPLAESNGGGAGTSDPVNFGTLAQQIESLTNANTALTARVNVLEQSPVAVTNAVNVTPTSLTVNIPNVPSTGTRFIPIVIGGVLEDFEVNGESGTVVAKWTNAAPSGVYIGWTKI